VAGKTGRRACLQVCFCRKIHFSTFYSAENERYQNIARLQNLSLKIENEVDTSLLTDNDDSMTIQRALK